jgi:hypothetical protein
MAARAGADIHFRVTRGRTSRAIFSLYTFKYIDKTYGTGEIPVRDETTHQKTRSIIDRDCINSGSLK